MTSSTDPAPTGVPRAVHFTVPAPKRGGDPEACQDAAASLGMPGAAVLCVADGVGSARHSGIGARIAVDTFTTALSGCRDFSAGTVLEAAHAAHDEWTARVRASPEWDHQRLRAFATTLGFAVAGPGVTLIGSVGDCFGVAMREPSAPEFHLILDQGRGGGYANETVSLASRDWARHLDERLFEVEDSDLCGVLLTTDGLEAVGIRHGRRSQGTPLGEVVQMAVQPGVVDRLLSAVRGSAITGPELAAELACNAEIMESKGDDIGVAIATW